WGEDNIRKAVTEVGLGEEPVFSLGLFSICVFPSGGRKTYIKPKRICRKKEGELSSDGLDRSILWKKAREDKNRIIPHDATKERAETIEKLTE
ncbi:hypothetical protein MKX03_035452, partial [Papaver bracteatum]